METHPLDSRTGRFPWQVVLIFVAAAAISRAPAVIVLAFGVLVSWVVVAVTGRLALSAVAVRLTLSPDRIVAGEQAIATLEIANRKPIPLPWLEARIFLGEGVEPSRGADEASSISRSVAASRMSRRCPGRAITPVTMPPNVYASTRIGIAVPPTRRRASLIRRAIASTDPYPTTPGRWYARQPTRIERTAGTRVGCRPARRTARANRAASRGAQPPGSLLK